MRAMVIVAVLLLGWSVANAQEAPTQVPGAVTVNVLQARYLYEQGALFVDVRPQREWLWGHVNGAVQLGLADEFKSLKQPDLPREIALVIYCESEICSAGAQAAKLAVSWGYSQVYYFREGYFAWQLLDFPLAKGFEEPNGLIAQATRVAH